MASTQFIASTTKTVAELLTPPTRPRRPLGPHHKVDFLPGVLRNPVVERRRLRPALAALGEGPRREEDSHVMAAGGEELREGGDGGAWGLEGRRLREQGCLFL